MKAYKVTAPAFTMTARHAKAWEKAIITKSHAANLGGQPGEPGPGEYHPHHLGEVGGGKRGAPIVF